VRGAAAFVGIAVGLSTVEGEELCVASSTLVHTSEPTEGAA